MSTTLNVQSSVCYSGRVSLSAILLRLLLSLSLILNGSGYAAAAAKMQMHHPASVADVSSTSKAQKSSPCPEHGGVTSVAGHAAESSSATPDDNRPECCKSAKCAGACLQHVPTAVTIHWIGPATITHSNATRPMKAAHATPALPHRIRPPIV